MKTTASEERKPQWCVGSTNVNKTVARVYQWRLDIHNNLSTEFV